MQRASYLITLGPAHVEGTSFERDGRPVGGSGWPVSADERPVAGRIVEALDAFLDEQGWSGAPAVLVMPTSLVSFRRLEFPFRESKKIRQALPFELENELLDAPSEYAAQFTVHPREDGSAHVPVYLVPHSDLSGALESCERHGLVVQKVTFAAQALLEAEPPPTGRHFQVYLGADEAFVTLLLDGEVRTVQNLALPCERLRDALRAQGADTPARMLAALGGENEEDGALEHDWVGHLRGMLGEALGDLNRFLRIHAADEPFTLTLHGAYAPLFDWRPGDPELVLRPLAVGTAAVVERAYFGPLAELEVNARGVLNPRGINFARRTGAWISQLREMRWGLATAAILLVLLGTVLGTHVYYRTAQLHSRLEHVNNRIRAELNIPVAENPGAVNQALAKLEDERTRLRKERAAEARFAGYHYDALNLIMEVSRIVNQVPKFTVESLTFNRERFTMAGTTDNYSDSEGVKRRLLALPRFEGRTAKVTHSKSGDLIRYRLSIEP